MVGLNREVEADLVVDAVAAKAIPTSNRLANINVRTSIKDRTLRSPGSDSRHQSTCNLRQDLTLILISLANDTIPLQGTSLLLVIKTGMSLIQEKRHPRMHALATQQTADCRTMDPVELRRVINVSSMLCEVHNSHARRNLVYRQHRPFQASEHPFCLQPHQLQPLDLPLNIRM